MVFFISFSFLPFIHSEKVFVRAPVGADHPSTIHSSRGPGDFLGAHKAHISSPTELLGAETVQVRKSQRLSGWKHLGDH